MPAIMPIEPLQYDIFNKGKQADIIPFHNPNILTTCKINNKRYLGNKYKLLNFIRNIVDTECVGVNTIADVFAGTGAVSSAFMDKKLIINDLLYSNYICHMAWFGKQKYSTTKIKKILIYYNQIHPVEDNYVSNNFSETFFNRENCKKIGFIREDIESKFRLKQINEKERALLITSLLYSMDKIANTCGHYDAYRKNGDLDKKLILMLPTPEMDLQDNHIFNEDANELVKRISADLVYLDPPYNSRQYCDSYHLLENIARWEKPAVSGIAKKMDRTKIKSTYCTSHATEAFKQLISNITAKYILLSYNNMEENGDCRSNAKISDKDILDILQTKGEVKIFTQKYKSFTTGKSPVRDNEERLFLCVCNKDIKEPQVQSPLNYLGGKYKLLKQILPLFPKNIDNFVDLFAGGGNVGINVQANKIILNDKDSHLCGIYSLFQKKSKEDIFSAIDNVIAKFSLSDSTKFGYEHYACQSDSGLQTYNKQGFNKLRDLFNLKKVKDDEYFILLYVLIVYSFNNQLRFNKNGAFNLPVGKRDFNAKMKRKLSLFIDKIKDEKIIITNCDFREYKPDQISKDTFVYADPPYLITTATYNERNAWTEYDEADLLEYLKKLDEHGVHFALSNVLYSKGKQNTLLANWVKENNYRVVHLNYSYGNSNYQTKDKTSKTDEVLVLNY